MSGELRPLTSVRGLAAWCIVVYHLRRYVAMPATAGAVLAKGYLAVDFFFLLSGFVIALNYAGPIRAEGWRAVPGFLQRRVARIWPLHLAMLAFGVGIALVLIATGRPDTTRFVFADLPAHVFLVQNWGWTDSLDWNDPTWSVSTEMFAYLLFPPLAMTVDWERLSSAAIVGAALAITAALAGLLAARGVHELGEAIPRLGLIRCIAEFTIGTAMSALWRRWRVAPLRPAIGGAVVAALMLAGLAGGVVIETVAIPIGFAAALLALALSAERPRHILSGWAIHYLGEISFATYLAHSLIWKAYTLVAVHRPYPLPAATIAPYLAIVLAASVALHHGVERPAQRWARRLRLPGRRRRGSDGGRPVASG